MESLSEFSQDGYFFNCPECKEIIDMTIKNNLISSIEDHFENCQYGNETPNEELDNNIAKSVLQNVMQDHEVLLQKEFIAIIKGKFVCLLCQEFILYSSSGHHVKLHCLSAIHSLKFSQPTNNYVSHMKLKCLPSLNSTAYKFKKGLKNLSRKSLFKKLPSLLELFSFTDEQFFCFLCRSPFPFSQKGNTVLSHLMSKIHRVKSFEMIFAYWFKEPNNQELLVQTHNTTRSLASNDLKIPNNEICTEMQGELLMKNELNSELVKQEKPNAKIKQRDPVSSKSSENTNENNESSMMEGTKLSNELLNISCNRENILQETAHTCRVISEYSMFEASHDQTKVTSIECNIKLLPSKSITERLLEKTIDHDRYCFKCPGCNKIIDMSITQSLFSSIQDHFQNNPCCNKMPIEKLANSIAMGVLRDLMKYTEVILNKEYITIMKGNLICKLCQEFILYSSFGSHVKLHCISGIHNDKLNEAITNFVSHLQVSSLPTLNSGNIQFQQVMISLSRQKPFDDSPSFLQYFSFTGSHFWCFLCRLPFAFAKKGHKVLSHLQTKTHRANAYKMICKYWLKNQQLALENHDPPRSITNDMSRIESDVEEQGVFLYERELLDPKPEEQEKSNAESKYFSTNLGTDSTNPIACEPSDLICHNKSIEKINEDNEATLNINRDNIEVVQTMSKQLLQDIKTNYGSKELAMSKNIDSFINGFKTNNKDDVIMFKLNKFYISFHNDNFFCKVCQDPIAYSKDGYFLKIHILSMKHNKLLIEITDFCLSNDAGVSSFTKENLAPFESVSCQHPYDKMPSLLKCVTYNNYSFYCKWCEIQIQCSKLDRKKGICRQLLLHLTTKKHQQKLLSSFFNKSRC